MIEAKMRLIGAHVSAEGGIENAIARIGEIGGNCLQLFSGSPRVWQKRDLSSFDYEKFRTEQQKLSIESVFIHALYLVNLASAQSELVTKSVKALIYEMQFNSLVKGSGVIAHLGSHQGLGWDAVRYQIVKQLQLIIASTPENSLLLIENSAGQNGKIGSDLEEIRWLLDQINSSRLGWCFDTCHGFSAGYALGLVNNLQVVKPINQKVETAFTAIDKLNLWPELKCIHVNDSAGGFGGGQDHHANLGQGQIPFEDWAWFLNQEEMKTLPLILEVPGFEKKGPDKQNVDILKEWLQIN